MAVKLTMAEKEMMSKVLKQDLSLIESEVFRQFHELWEKTRRDVEDELGFHKKNEEIEKLQAEIQKLTAKIGEVQASMREYAEHPTVQDYLDAGLAPPKNQRNGFIYNHNVEFMGIPVNSKMDCLIAKKIKSQCDPERPLNMLCEIAQSAYRALVMSGTYDEARDAYDKFYSLDFQRFGVKIPRRLDEIKKIEGHNLMSATPVIVPRLSGPVEASKGGNGKADEAEKPR